VAERRWAGSWLGSREPDGSQYPGEKLGLPKEGPASVAGLGRRLLALLIDWLLCLLISLWAFHTRAWTLPIWAAQDFLLTALAGMTIGKRLLGTRIVRPDGKPVGFGWALLRTVLLLAVVPALITDHDMRGLHDRAANTVVVRI
jgi:uncharacterized RDD family membrane protein YckC